jgi:hypothetical protein
MSSSSEDMNLQGDLSVNNLTVRGTCTGCGGGSATVPIAHFFTNVAVTGAVGAPLVGLVVPTTAPIVIPVGWRVAVQAFAGVQGGAPGFPSVHPQIPGPFPLGAPSSGGGIGTVTIRRDPGPSAIIWHGIGSPVFVPFVNVAIQPTGYAASMSLASRGFFVSDGLAHVYEVEIGIPSWFGVSWATETDAFDIGLGSPIPGLGLSIYAYPP